MGFALPFNVSAADYDAAAKIKYTACSEMLTA